MIQLDAYFLGTEYRVKDLLRTTHQIMIYWRNYYLRAKG